MGSAELRDAGMEGVCEMMSAEQEGEPSESGPVSVERPDDGLEGRELAAVLEVALVRVPRAGLLVTSGDRRRKCL